MNPNSLFLMIPRNNFRVLFWLEYKNAYAKDVGKF